MLFSIWLIGQNAWINELHYDDNSKGRDANEVVEVVIENPGDYTLSLFEVHLYNGNGGATYASESLNNFTVGNTEGNYIIYYWYPSSIQNGAPDGLSLSYNGTLISGQFLSYEGEFTATNGPASAMTSTDIGVAESNSPTPTGHSFQLSGIGTEYSDFTWQLPAATQKGH